MNFKLAEAVANAVLYEGYILYPYRPSAVKTASAGLSAAYTRRTMPRKAAAVTTAVW